MARTAVTVTTLAANAFTAKPAGTTADPTNDHVVDVAGDSEGVVIEITQTDASARIATVLAGDNPPALEAGQGNLAKSMAQNEVWILGPLTSGRFIQNDGTILIDLAASFAGTIRAYKVPRNA